MLRKPPAISGPRAIGFAPGLRRRPRSAATLVEATLVISMALLFMFGVYEYGRYILTLQAVENAAREGARFAVVNTTTASTADVNSVVLNSLGGIDQQLANFTITVNGIILVPQNSGETAGQVLPDTPASGSSPAIPGWTTASPTDGIRVQIDGDYTPILPTFLLLSTTIHVRSTSVMYSEGN
jgi:Flp pilus assembly protein TadG